MPQQCIDPLVSLPDSAAKARYCALPSVEQWHHVANFLEEHLISLHINELIYELHVIEDNFIIIVNFIIIGNFIIIIEHKFQSLHFSHFAPSFLMCRNSKFG